MIVFFEDLLNKHYNTSTSKTITVMYINIIGCNYINKI